ncbi:MAG: hypothetical protein AAFX99_22105, partial [Myxococcota bacterium]
VHISRTTPARSWNLWIAQGEPHKRTHTPVTTPWAMSVTVPHNTAVMATSASGQRVIEGPCVELLEYEETLATLTLSTGTPKSDDATLETCFLRTVGNRVSDGVLIETRDFVEINLQVSYRVTFASSAQERWFNHVNYVQFLCDHLRSLIRGRCRQMSLTDLWPELPAIIRDTVLGERTEEGRKGRFFEENGMLVTEVEVLGATILDTEIDALLGKVQQELVALQISNRQLREQLASDELRAEIEQRRAALQAAEVERRAELDELVRRLKHAAALVKVSNEEEVKRESQRVAAALQEAEQQFKLRLESVRVEAEAQQLALETEATVAAEEMVHTEQIAFERAQSELKIGLIEARSRATVAEREAVQAGLIEALTALGDKTLLSEAARNMNLISLFKGKQVGTILAEVLGGSALDRTLGVLASEGALASETPLDEDA